MNALAAYSLMVLIETERMDQIRRYPTPPSRPSLSARIGKALGSRVRIGRASAAQPA